MIDVGSTDSAPLTTTPEHMAVMVRHASGIACVPMGAKRSRSLCLPQMVEQNSRYPGFHPVRKEV
ncbi:3,4-dihydroxy-2-butanone-4-phosphate synthase [Saccharopolyspora sp. 5N708]|uniref:3,4-dihydroxy-2-butanone-4-phosphate synthase n=1 Tax=Saccharopolyspora sp. 5N708 TaxID=3457424 RepID=UPI003FD40DD3